MILKWVCISEDTVYTVKNYTTITLTRLFVSIYNSSLCNFYVTGIETISYRPDKYILLQMIREMYTVYR